MKTKITYERWDEYYRNLTVHTEWNGMSKPFVVVNQDISFEDAIPKKPTANWWAMGSVPIEVALAASVALKEAVRVAGEMENMKEWKRLLPPIKGAKWVGDKMPEVYIQDGKIWFNKEGWRV
jgi:hypothetical protein